jgi:hypothetical protein
MELVVGCMLGTPALLAFRVFMRGLVLQNNGIHEQAGKVNISKGKSIPEYAPGTPGKMLRPRNFWCYRLAFYCF